MSEPAPQLKSIRKSRPILGVAMMIGFCFFVALLDASAKNLMHSGMSVAMTLWGRYFAQLILYTTLLALFFRKQLKEALHPARPKLQILRSLILVAETGCIFLALSYLPLAETLSVTFIYPLLVAVLAVPFLGERLGPQRLIGVLVGFVGVLIMLRPDGGLFHPAILAALTSAVLFSIFQLMTRRLSESDTAWTTLFHTALGGSVASLALALLYWQTPDSTTILTFLLLGGLGILAHGCLVLAFTWAPAGLVVNFSYAELLFAAFLGWLFFNHLPDKVSIVGMAIIVGGGVFVLWRERQQQHNLQDSQQDSQN